MHDDVADLVTGVDRAAHPIIEGRRLARLAIEQRVTALQAITEEPIVTQGVIDDMHDGVGSLIAGVIGAQDAIINDRRLAAEAT